MGGGKEMKMKRTDCAFCRGKGVDPFQLFYDDSICQVCGGRGRNSIPEHAVSCAYCHGTGVQPHRRLVCTVCGGTGSILIHEPTGPCPECNGKGMCAGEYLPCRTCRGKGLLSVAVIGLKGDCHV